MTRKQWIVLIVGLALLILAALVPPRETFVAPPWFIIAVGTGIALTLLHEPRSRS